MAGPSYVELFDDHGVSFVSVTQQFNTTTSMGRLTLKKVSKCRQRPNTVADDLSNRQHGHREHRARNAPHRQQG
jgi:hypothetical protein